MGSEVDIRSADGGVTLFGARSLVFLSNVLRDARDMKMASL